MSERIFTRMPTPEGVSAGGQALAKMPIGRNFHDMWIRYAGVTLAQLPEIRIKLNGKVVHRYSAQDRDAMNKFNGLAAANGWLVIPFDRIGLKTRAGEEEFKIRTGTRAENGVKIDSFHVEIDIASAAAAPELEIWATQSAVDPTEAPGPGAVLHCTPFTRSAAGAGELQVSDLPFGGETSVYLNRTYIKTANLTKLRIERDTYAIFERPKALNEAIQVDGERTPQAGYVVFDTTEKGYGGSMVVLAGASDFRYMLEMSGAEQVTFWPEYVGRLGN